VTTKITYPFGVSGITISGSRDVGKEREVHVLSGFGTGAHYGVHNSNVDNLVRGIAERVLYVSTDKGLQPCRKPLNKPFTRLHAVKRQLLRVLRPTTVVTPEEYPQLYDGRKRGVYQRAYESLMTKGLTHKDAYVSTFVKAEKVNFTAKGDPAPRVIQPRSPRYNLEVGCYLKNFEKEVAHGFARAFGYRVILKGLNADGVAQQLRENWDHYSNPVAVGLDASRFDQHVSVDALKFEHSVYNDVFKCPKLAQLLKCQLRNRGYGRIGETLVSYTVDGCRMSGDINTGLGNCLLMSLMVLNYFREFGLEAHLANNGDDCVVICDRSSLYKLDKISDYFTEFGFNLKREPTVDIFERIQFCQCQPVLLSSGSYRMVRDPWTAMSKDCVSLLPMENLQQFETWRDAIGVCGKQLTSGVPVWESFYRALTATGNRHGGDERVRESGMGFMAKDVEQLTVISSESRYSFWLAYGIDPDLQIIMENNWPAIVYTSNPPMINSADLSRLSYNPLTWLSNAIAH
jgi:hypothetical protein